MKAHGFKQSRIRRMPPCKSEAGLCGAPSTAAAPAPLRVPAGWGQCWLVQGASTGGVTCSVPRWRAEAAKGRSCRAARHPTSALLAVVGTWPTPTHVLHFNSAQYNSPVINTLDSFPESGPHYNPSACRQVRYATRNCSESIKQTILM